MVVNHKWTSLKYFNYSFFIGNILLFKKYCYIILLFFHINNG